MRETQQKRILCLLRAAARAYDGGWVPLPEILKLGVAQYNARIKELRDHGVHIENRIQMENGVRHSFYRVVEEEVVCSIKSF